MRFKTGFEGRKAASIGWIMFILMGGVTHIQLCYVVHQYFHKIQWRFLSTMPCHCIILDTHVFKIYLRKVFNLKFMFTIMLSTCVFFSLDIAPDNMR